MCWGLWASKQAEHKHSRAGGSEGWAGHREASRLETREQCLQPEEGLRGSVQPKDPGS